MQLHSDYLLNDKDDLPLVSIIIPVYNQEDYLDDALNDICGQSYENIEIVVVNDGSTDSSQTIVEAWARLDDRIVVVNKSNGGLVSANISGLKHARGQFICFYDPDDRIGSTFVELLVQEIGEGIDFVAASFSYQYPDCCKQFPLSEDSILDSDELDTLSDKFILNSTLSLDDTIFVARWNKIYRKSCLDKFIDLYEKCSDVALGEDSVFTFLLLQNARKGKVVKKDCTYRYVQHENSMMHSVDWKKTLSSCERTLERFSEICNLFARDDTPAEILYYALASGLLSTSSDNSLKTGIEVYHVLMNSENYRKALISARKLNSKKHINLALQLIRCPAIIYVGLRRIRKLLFSRN